MKSGETDVLVERVLNSWTLLSNNTFSVSTKFSMFSSKIISNVEIGKNKQSKLLSTFLFLCTDIGFNLSIKTRFTNFGYFYNTLQWWQGIVYEFPFSLSNHWYCIRYRFIKMLSIIFWEGLLFHYLFAQKFQSNCQSDILYNGWLLGVRWGAWGQMRADRNSLWHWNRRCDWLWCQNGFKGSHSAAVIAPVPQG